MPTPPSRVIAGRGLVYREFPPSRSLASDVQYLWMLEANQPLATPLVQNSASKSGVDLILPIEGNFSLDTEHQLFGASNNGAYLVGALSRPHTLVSQGRCTALGARIRPGRAGSFFFLPMHDLTDQALAVRDLSEITARRLLDWAHTGRRSDSHYPVEEALLHLRAGRRLDDQGDGMAEVLRQIEAHRGNISVEALAGAMGNSVRELQRRFRRIVGLGPKLACRIARVEHAMTLLASGAGATGTAIAYAGGFYDQAHMVREFRSIAGVTPSGFLRGCGHSPTP